MTSSAPTRPRSAAGTDPDGCGCHEGRRLELSRRGILKALGGTALVTATLGDAQLAFGATAGTKPNVLVTIVLAGGIDGLSMIVPNGDPDYAANRPGIAVPASTTQRVDSMFGLHPALAPLFPFWTAGTLGAVQAVGQVSPTRSHFEAMAELERAAPDSSLRTGWLNRTIGLLPENGPLEAVALGSSATPGHLMGSNPTLSAYRLADVDLSLDYITPMTLWQQAFTQLHAGERPGPSAPMRNALAAVGAAGAVPPSSATGYPANNWGTALKDIARMVKADVGLRVASATYGGWDHHENFGGPTATGGTFAGRLSGLAQGLAAFATDLGTELDRVTVVTLTEFGRRVKENGSSGVDHGHGFACLMLGGGVNGGKVHGRWPGLAKANLDQGLDLAVTTDYRSLMSEILVSRMGVSGTTQIFPGFTPTAVGAVRTT
ncbi:MAG: DUF1501 domain-containing protein [Kineosporiaceae bacterium]